MPRSPSADEMARFYPERAQRAGVEGHALIECVVTIGGRAEACRILSESPGGYGFGDSTVKLAERFRLTPKTVNGKPVAGGVIRVPLRWSLAG